MKKLSWDVHELKGKKKQERSAGTLLHITSLPSPYGIGTLGRTAYAFADALHRTGQKYWQVLPIGPVGFGYSPYQSPSSFAGNTLLIDIELLIEEGLITAEEAAGDWGWDTNRVDFEKVISKKEELLRLAFERGREKDAEAQNAFYKEAAAWLSDYALFMAIGEEQGGKPWYEWDEDIRLRRAKALKEAEERLSERIAYHKYVQYLFFSQWSKLKAYLEKLGIKIIGDMPIYVALDSADVWASPKEFLLDERMNPTSVAGVPPDYFSEKGQLWGNPLYDWAHMKRDGYKWWRRRIAEAGKLFDVVRIDHFRAIADYWVIPAGEKDARGGHWEDGPGMDFIRAISKEGVELIAEDLGLLSPAVTELLEASGLPGMRVTQFAFGSRDNSTHLPHNIPENCVAYTGTHDNDTLEGWFRNTTDEVRAYVKEYMGLNSEEGWRTGMLRGVLCSQAARVIIQMQDWLGLGDWARMNVPSTVGTNWYWRLAELPNAEVEEHMRSLVALYARAKEYETGI